MGRGGKGRKRVGGYHGGQVKGGGGGRGCGNRRKPPRAEEGEKGRISSGRGRETGFERFVLFLRGEKISSSSWRKEREARPAREEKEGLFFILLEKRGGVHHAVLSRRSFVSLSSYRWEKEGKFIFQEGGGGGACIP